MEEGRDDDMEGEDAEEEEDEREEEEGRKRRWRMRTSVNPRIQSKMLTYTLPPRSLSVGPHK
eukprot:267927-Pyramimonas_sp.AAC.1